METPQWIKKQKTSENFEIVKGSHDENKDWKQDDAGYLLIRVNQTDKTIEVAHCTNEHVITKMITGKKADEIYHTIIKLGLISRLDHAAYLGTELKKAEIALKTGEPYVQA